MPFSNLTNFISQTFGENIKSIFISFQVRGFACILSMKVGAKDWVGWGGHPLGKRSPATAFKKGKASQREADSRRRADEFACGRK